MSVGERLAQVMNRGYDRMRHPAAFRIRAGDAVTGGFDGLRGRRYAVVVTFRRNGEAVPSAVWYGVDAAGRIYVQTAVQSGKVKRIRNDPRALVAPSDVRGRPTGPVVAGRARVVPREEWPHAEATLAAAYGLGRKLYVRAFHMADDVQAYVEISPVTA